jgi:rRNA maturation RNase YbeY
MSASGSGRAFDITVRKTVHRPVPVLPYERLARYVLGPSYELSLVICGDALARRMYRTYRVPALKQPETKKSYASNVLSFPYDAGVGEIFLNADKAEREARLFHTTTRARLALLFIHGCCHLKGLPHGRAMETLERKTLRHFGLAA